jgi:hypothetical protein
MQGPAGACRIQHPTLSCDRRKHDLNRGAGAGRAAHPEPAAERFNPVGESDQAGAGGEVGAATAVVTDDSEQ